MTLEHAADYWSEKYIEMKDRLRALEKRCAEQEALIELLRKPAPIQPPPVPFWYPPLQPGTPVPWPANPLLQPGTPWVPTQPIITCEVKP